jgi:hypothetical protein
MGDRERIAPGLAALRGRLRVGTAEAHDGAMSGQDVGGAVGAASSERGRATVCFRCGTRWIERKVRFDSIA